MKNTLRKNFLRIAVCVLAIALFIPTMAASAISTDTDEIGYETYTYWSGVSSKKSRKAVYNKPMFDTYKVVNEYDLECTQDSTFVDVHSSKSGLTYVLDSGTSRIIVLDSSYKIVKTIYAVVEYPAGATIPTTPYVPAKQEVTTEKPAATEESKETTEKPATTEENTGTGTTATSEEEKKKEEEKQVAGQYDKKVDGVTYYNFKGAKGIFVDENDNVFIADTVNKRVLKCNNNGVFVRNYLLPEADIIPDDFNYAPIKVAVDYKGYVYILSSGSYYGAILYSPKDEFLGFYGANDVTSTIGQAIVTVFNRIFANSAKLSASTKSLPYSFSDIWTDDEGFVYTATGTNGSTVFTKAQIKRLNPGGSNILGSEDINFADEGAGRTKMSGARNQDIKGLSVDKDGFMYCIDGKYGRVLVYDDECTMVTAFGGGIGTGEQNGLFRTLTAIVLNGDDVVLTDSMSNTLTIFRKNDYGKKLLKAQAMTINGDYEDAKGLWQEVYSQDKNCQLAYKGLARAEYVSGNYTEAMELAKTGYDRDTYALAFSAIRTDWIRTHFVLVLLGAIVLIGLLIAWMIVSKKKDLSFIKNRKIKMATSICIHPVDNFHEIKEKGISSYRISIIVILLYYVFTVLETTAGGFSFVYYDKSTYNALIILLRTVGLAILWTISNWAISTLLGGKGKTKEILTVFSYSLIPTLIGNILYVVLTNVLVPDEAAFLTIFMTIATWYTYLLLMVGTMVIHDFSLGRFIGTTMLTILGMAIVLFLIVTVIILLQQTWGFLLTLYTEIIQLF